MTRFDHTRRRTDRAAQRPAIADAWHRAEMAGLRPENRPAPRRDFEIEPDSRLLVAARPVLEQVAADLADTRFALLLTDSRQRVVDHRIGTPRLRDHMEQMGFAIGTVWDEETTGTNALSTVHELRRGLSVVGDEHYLEEAKRYCCYGEPLFDPTSGRLEGVVDITGPVEDATSLLGPFLARARAEIEQRLLDTSRAAHQTLLRAYEAASDGARHPVVALGEDMMLANHAASTGLTRDDTAVLRALVAEGARGDVIVRLASGPTARVECSPVSSGAAVLRIHPRPAGLDTAIATASFVRPARAVGNIVVMGEEGTGRSAEAADRASTAAATVRAADEEQIGDPVWGARMRDAWARGEDVIVEDLHLLGPAAVTRLRTALVDRDLPGTIVATCGPRDGLSPHHGALVALFDEHVVLRPLREDRGRIPRLATAWLAELTGPDGPRLGPGLTEHLVALPWPGNLHELRRVVEHLATVRAHGECTVDDLPPRYREAPWQRALSPLERSEYATIVAALRDAGGNKLRAAQHLGISRGTLYARMRRFRIPS